MEIRYGNKGRIFIRKLEWKKAGIKYRVHIEDPTDVAWIEMSLPQLENLAIEIASAVKEEKDSFK